VTDKGDVRVGTTDTDNIIEGSGNVLSLISLQTVENSLVMRDVHNANEEGYLLQSYSKNRDSGAVYKASGIYGPYYRQDVKSKYDFRAIF